MTESRSSSSASARARTGRAGCGARPRCATSSARRRSRPTTSSTRSSSSRARACGARSPRCRGIDQVSADALAGEARELASLGIKAVLLFGIPSAKDPHGLESFADDGIVQNAIRALKDASPELVVVTDVCLCEYTDHGHCGLLDDGRLRPERRDARGPRAHRRLPRRGGRRRRRAERDDRRDGRRDPARARRRGARARRGALVRGQVRVRVLRPVPRGRRGRAAVRRPQEPPDGSGERARGAARGGARRGAGRRRAHGQARARLPRRRRARARALPRAPARRVQRQRRVRDGRRRRPRTAGSTSGRRCSRC